MIASVIARRSFLSTGATVGVAATFATGADAGQRLTISGVGGESGVFPLTLQRRP